MFRTWLVEFGRVTYYTLSGTPLLLNNPRFLLPKHPDTRTSPPSTAIMGFCCFDTKGKDAGVPLARVSTPLLQGATSRPQTPRISTPPLRNPTSRPEPPRISTPPLRNPTSRPEPPQNLIPLSQTPVDSGKAVVDRYVFPHIPIPTGG